MILTVIVKERMNNFTNKALLAKSTHAPHVEELYNMTNPQGLKSIVILYVINEPMNLQL